MMKPCLITILVIFASFGANAKVTYDDAIASSQEYYDNNAVVNSKPRDYGLGNNELQNQTGQGNDMGVWVKTSNKDVYLQQSKGYSYMLAESAVGQKCVKGSKGILIQIYSDCSKYSCQSKMGIWGHPAECR